MSIRKSRFQINSIKFINRFEHNFPCNTECSICRESLNLPSLSYQNRNLPSYVIIGQCGHAYHQECINAWAGKNGVSDTCPLCSKKWVPQAKEKFTIS